MFLSRSWPRKITLELAEASDGKTLATFSIMLGWVPTCFLSLIPFNIWLFVTGAFFRGLLTDCSSFHNTLVGLK